MLIRVDLPAPLSPTRPSASPRSTSRVTPFSAWTPEYHLCRCLISMIGLAMSGLHLDRPCALTQPRIHHNREDGEQADRHLEPVGVDPAQHQPVVDHADQRRADDTAGDGAYAAGERCAADHRRRYRLQL